MGGTLEQGLGGGGGDVGEGRKGWWGYSYATLVVVTPRFVSLPAAVCGGTGSTAGAVWLTRRVSVECPLTRHLVLPLSVLPG